MYADSETGPVCWKACHGRSRSAPKGGHRYLAARILTAEVAQTLQDEVIRDRELLTWVVMKAEGGGDVMARPVASGRGALPYVLRAPGRANCTV